MVFTGFCNKQNTNYSVEFEVLDSSDLEEQRFENGRLICQYSALFGCCRTPKQCSILQNLNK